MARLETLLTLVSQTVDFPEVRVNILDEDTQYTIALVGAGDPASVARSESFCDAVVRTGRPVSVDDAALDPRFAGLTSVMNGQIGSYLGVPLIGRESMVTGAVCVIDPTSREIGRAQLERLTEFGKVVEDQLDLIRRLREQRLEGVMATDEIARAIHDGEIVPWYQPVVDLATGDIRGFEALARWEHPTRGVDDPLLFVPVAEDSDLIISLDLAVIRRALADFARWQSSRPALRLSVNLSGRHLTNRHTAATLHQAVLDAGINPGSVDLELTETTRVDISSNDIHEVVQDLRHLGFQVWLDDFGTGWSSLEHVLWLPVDGVKIDRAVAVALGTPVGDALVSAVTGLAAAMGLRTTIEGIETRAHADHALDLGCELGQGYLWGAPAPAASVPQILARASTPSQALSSPPSRPDPVRALSRGRLHRGNRGAADGVNALDTTVQPGRPGPVTPSTVGSLALATLDALPDATAVLDHTGLVIAVNHTWRMFALDNGGTEADTGVGISYLDVCTRSAQTGCDDATQVAARLRTVLAGGSVEEEYEYPCPSPVVGRWFLLRITALAGPVPGAVVSHVNTTRRKTAETELAHAASHDPLTGLANRILFNRQLATALRRRPHPSNHTGTAGVLYIDLDSFKPVNDTFGHSAGDELLITVAHRLRNAVRPGDTTARLGGDEFAVIAPRVDRTGLAAIAERIQRSLAEPHNIHGHTVHVPGSIGAHLAHSGDDPDEALHAADQLMYATKRARPRTPAR